MSEKHRKEIESLLNKSESGVNKRLQKLYRELAFEINDEIVQLAKEIDETDKFSKKLQKERLEAIRSQMFAKVNQLEGEQKKEIFDFLRHDGHVAFNELFYDFEMSEEIPLSFTMLTDKQINVIINTPVANRKLSTRLNGNSTKMKQNLNRVLTRGFAKGLSTQKMAVQIAEIGGANYRRAMNIARTESGRVTSVARQQSQNHAKSLGLKLEKQWISTLDKLTRHTHQLLDGKRVGIDEYFEIGGHKALQPHMFGVAAEDCNCRCRTITIVNGMGPELRKDNESKEVIEYQNYDEWLAGKQEMPKEKELDFHQVDVKSIYNNSKGDRRKFAKELLSEYEVDAPVSIRKISARGQNGFQGFGIGGRASISEFVLQSDDPRSSSYQFKTALHEAYHSKMQGLEVPVSKERGKFSFDDWLSIEETMTEVASHYQMSLINDEKLMPAYPKYLSVNLPRLQKVKGFENSTSFIDFGKNAMNYRFNEELKTADWRGIHAELNNVTFDFYGYIKDNYVEELKDNRSEVLDMIYQNTPQFKQHDEYIQEDYDSFVKNIVDGKSLVGNQEMIGQHAMTALYRLVGVKKWK